MSSAAVVVALPSPPNLNGSLSSPTPINSSSNKKDGIGEQMVMKETGDGGYKWRLVIACDGTRYAVPSNKSISICIFSPLQVALLIQIGREALPPDIVPKILATRDRRVLAKYTMFAPPHGLCLATVKYNEEHLRLPSGSFATSFGMHYTIGSCKLPFY
ncbi:hypothetical protein FF1_021675 [Malus domestica]